MGELVFGQLFVYYITNGVVGEVAVSSRNSTKNNVAPTPKIALKMWMKRRMAIFNYLSVIWCGFVSV